MKYLSNKRIIEDLSISRYTDLDHEAIIKVNSESNKFRPTPQKAESDINIFDSDSSKFENESSFISIQKNDSTNQKRSNLDNPRNASKEFIKILQEEYFEYGITSKSELFVLNKLNSDLLITKNWINSVFIENYHKNEIIVGLLRVISRVDPTLINPEGQVIAMACLSHKSIEVKESAIRIFENWGDITSLNILKNLSIAPTWLQEYVESVIIDLEYNLCQN